MTRQGAAIVTGSLGLVGAEAVQMLAALGFDVIGIDSDARRQFFGEAASTAAVAEELTRAIPRYRHFWLDIRDGQGLARLFRTIGPDCGVIVHAAAQPSHDWAADDPATDFAINATATLDLLELTRRHAPEAAFLFMSTNKVYGDHPNELPLIATETRFVLPDGHRFAAGIDETMSLDQCRHSLFGVSKTAADLLVQEYAHRFGLFTVAFRAGCISGAAHRATERHGFLAYLCASAAIGRTYRVFGHGGRQVRDNLHVCDMASALRQVIQGRKRAAVYNIGGGTGASCSILEALRLAKERLGRPAPFELVESARFGDHMWWVSDFGCFQADYPDWRPTRTVLEIIDELLGRHCSDAVRR